MQKLRICFAGTPAFAAEHLAVLISSHHEIVAVFTQPDRPAGRGKKLLPSAVKQLALAHEIPVHQPVSLKADDQQQLLRDFSPDVLIVVAYGLILPQAILDIPRYGCINVHASLLPRWRGAAPIERALLAGDESTGVTIMRMDAGLDTGDMLTTEAVTIEAEDTRMNLEAKLAIAGSKALMRVLENIQSALKNAVKQDDSQSTYAAKLDKSEALIHWDQTATVINRQIRAGVGRAPAYGILDKQRLRILKANPLQESSTLPPGTIVMNNKDEIRIACNDSQLAVTSVQLPGKTAMRISDVMHSKPDMFNTGKAFTLDESGD